MTGRTHMMFGLSCGAVGLLLIHQTNLFVGMAALTATTVGSLAPDIDCPPGRDSYGASITHWPLMGLVSRGMSKISSHRRFWHTPIAQFIFAFINFLILYGLCMLIVKCFGYDTFSFLYPDNYEMQSFQYSDFILLFVINLTVFFLIGCFSHLIADTFNPQGVPWLFPLTKLSTKYHVPVISVRTSSVSEGIYRWIVFFTMVLSCGYWLYLTVIGMLH
jgi:membrane-bound metal-dependent hydrolase YbcI (DUF457 family)